MIKLNVYDNIFLILKMLFLILNNHEPSPYYDTNEVIFTPVINTPTIVNEYEYYSEIYKEFMYSSCMDDLFYMCGIILSTIGIYYFSNEIQKSINWDES